jgi:hypothetical protein
MINKKDKCEQLKPKFYIGEECSVWIDDSWMGGWAHEFLVIVEEIRKFGNEFKYIVRDKSTQNIIQELFSEEHLSKKI